jgi:hypothetical protein
MGADEHFQRIISKKKRQKELDEIECPFCKHKFSSSNPLLFNQHTKKCGLSRIQISKKCDLYPPGQDIVLNNLIFTNKNEYLKNIRNLYYNINDKSFDNKISELKAHFAEKKKAYELQAFVLSVNRQNLLKETMEKTKNIIDLYKDWKIDFIGEVSYDAGGILREFFTNIFQTLESEKLNLFIQSDSNDFSYILNPFLMQNTENFNYCALIGLLMAKALIQNITINICFNKLIYKMILQEKIEFEDLVFIDGPLYNSLRNLKENLEYNNLINPGQNNNDLIKELGLFYSIEMKDCYDHMHSFELVENGRNKIVEDLDDFIKQRIEFLIGLYEPFVKRIRESFIQYIPREKITCFTSNELELILNGRPFIDIDEWKLYTIYKAPYNENHQVIKWFWEILGKLSQKELSNLLLFSTGASRVPLGGFAELESNRGNLSQFTIEYIAYDNKIKNYIKAHTCFNRIDLPNYTNKNELEEAIRFVSEKEMWGFGIE